MNLDIEILRATFGDLVLQSIALQTQVKAMMQEKEQAEAKAKEDKKDPE